MGREPEPGEHAHVSGQRERGGAVGVLEQHAVGGQRIERRRRRALGAVRADAACAERVHRHEHDVERPHRAFLRRQHDRLAERGEHAVVEGRAGTREEAQTDRPAGESGERDLRRVPLGVEARERLSPDPASGPALDHAHPRHDGKARPDARRMDAEVEAKHRAVGDGERPRLDAEERLSRRGEDGDPHLPLRLLERDERHRGRAVGEVPRDRRHVDPRPADVGLAQQLHPPPPLGDVGHQGHLVVGGSALAFERHERDGRCRQRERPPRLSAERDVHPPIRPGRRSHDVEDAHDRHEGRRSRLAPARGGEREPDGHDERAACGRVRRHST
jgi:hypothetical protein